MREKIRKMFVGSVLILSSIFSLFGCVGHISQKKKTEKGRIVERKEQPHIMENLYPSAFQDRNSTMEPIVTSASAVNDFDDSRITKL